MPDFSDEADEAKLGLRRAVLAGRRALSAPVRARAAGLVQAELAALVRRLRPRVVTGYVPVGSEPGGPDLPEALAAALRAVDPQPTGLLLPVLRSDLDLDWATYTGPAGLHAAGYGLREPTGARLGRSAISSAGLVVVPAVAVDRRGVRLGRGGGSYDRALRRVTPGVPVVALLHEGELLDAVPALPHDVRVDAVVTPAGGLVRLPAG
ncbi:5-formyltetrahydrofolate cyclo-ligase [Plantactinospora siamensis]|uniref:5-formyltetrahydrofolate cyclo-ligase n=1 Tax=Plantactinospora siamensis TaxID=555372 RepID=A0ABV6NVF5_9ACTN